MRVARVYTGVADTRYLSIKLLRRATKNLHFDPTNLGDRPPTGEFIAPLHHTLLLLLQSPSLPTQPWPTGRRSPPSSNIVRPMSLENVLERMPDRSFLQTACLNALFVPILLIAPVLPISPQARPGMSKRLKRQSIITPLGWNSRSWAKGGYFFRSFGGHSAQGKAHS